MKKAKGARKAGDCSPALVTSLLAAIVLLIDPGDLLCERRISMAKVVAAETAQDLASAGMEIVGLEAGAGHHLVEKLFRDAKALNIVEGTGQIQRIIMGRSLVGLPR